MDLEQHLLMWLSDHRRFLGVKCTSVILSCTRISRLYIRAMICKYRFAFLSFSPLSRMGSHYIETAQSLTLVLYVGVVAIKYCPKLHRGATWHHLLRPSTWFPRLPAPHGSHLIERNSLRLALLLSPLSSRREPLHSSSHVSTPTISIRPMSAHTLDTSTTSI